MCACVCGHKNCAGFLISILILQKLTKANEELDQCMAELLQTTEQAEMKDVKVKRLEGEVISLLERITQITVTRCAPFLMQQSTHGNMSHLLTNMLCYRV